MASYESEEDHQLIQEEIDILNSIYIDELKITKDNSGITEFLEIVIHPATAGQAEQQYVCLTLILQIPDKYPHVEPKITIKNPRGISDEFVNCLKKSLEEYATENCGNQVLFSLIQNANDSLTHNNTPSCDCAVCLTGFQEEDSFTKTECYHYFHLSCLQRYIDVCTSDYEKEVAEIQQSMPQQTPKQLEIVCPVCREPISYQSEQNIEKVGLTSDKDELFVPNDDMRKWQEKMKELYKKQADQGGIIDVEAESNKFLLDISTTVSAPLASLRLHDDKKTSAYRESDERNTKATKSRRGNKHGNTYRERQLTNQKEERRFRKEGNDEDLNKSTNEFKSNVNENVENVIGSDMLPIGQLSYENDQKKAEIPSENNTVDMKQSKTEASDADKDNEKKSECDTKLEKEGNKQENTQQSKNLQETRTKQSDKKYEKGYNHYRTEDSKTGHWRNKDERSYFNGKQTRQAHSGGNSTRSVNPKSGGSMTKNKLQNVCDSPSANKSTTGDKQNSSSARDLHSEADSVSICHKSNETKNEHPCEVKDSTKKTLDESSTANTRSRQYHDRPSSRGQHHDRPSSRGQHHDRPSSRGQHHNRPSSRGQHHDQPSRKGQHHDRPSSRGQHHDRPSSRGQHHDRPSSRGQHHDRPSSRGQHHDRPSSRGQHHDRPSTRGQHHDRPSTRNQHHISGTRGQQQRSSGSTTEKRHHIGKGATNENHVSYNDTRTKFTSSNTETTGRQNHVVSISSEIKSGDLLNKISSTSDKVEKNNCNDDKLKHNEQLRSNKQSNKDKHSDQKNYKSRNHFQRQHSDCEQKKSSKSDKNDSMLTSFTQDKQKCESKVSPVSCGLKDIAYSIIEKKSETDNASSDNFLDKTSGPPPGFKSKGPVLPPPGF